MLTVRLVIAIILAGIGYSWAEKFEAKYGYQAWRLSKWVWALLFSLGLLVGLICCSIAESKAKKEYALRRSLPPPPPVFGQAGNLQYGQPQYGQPQYGQPQYGQPQYGQPQAAYPTQPLPAQPWPTQPWPAPPGQTPPT